MLEYRGGGNMRQFRYVIQSEDLFLSKFPYSRVLQNSFPEKHVFNRFAPDTCSLKDFKTWFRREIKKLRKLSIEEVNAKIYTFVDTLEVKYPSEFKKIGWWERKMIVEAWVDGRLVWKE